MQAFYDPSLIDKQRIDELRLLGISWRKIGKDIKISIDQLKRWRKRTNYVDAFIAPFNDITDAALDAY